MTKAEATKPAAARARGPYSTQACDSCRRKKIKCNGVKPVCSSCEGSKRSAECSWTGENVRVPRTEAHFEALRKRVEALQAYADSLESMLEQCRKEHGGTGVEFNFKQLRPPLNSPDATDEFERNGDMAEGDIMHELAMSAENLKLEDRNLVSYGTVAPFRFAEAPEHVSRFNQIIDNPDAHYVLLVEGASDSNPGLPWSKHLPKSVPLDRREHDRLLDLLFKFFTCWCLRVVPALFLRDMHRALSSDPAPDTSHYSPMLHNALMALATAFSDDPNLSNAETRAIFATRAKSFIEHECQNPNICVVQALSLLGSFHSSKGDQNLGYLYFGMSMRVGEILGLSVDCSKWVKAGLITHDDMLDRNWAHWTSYSLDVCWSLYVGRECSATLVSPGQTIPVPFVDSAFDQIPWHYRNEATGAYVPPQPNSLSRTFAKTCELLVIARRIMEVINGLHHPNSTHQLSDEVISRLDLQLHTWKGGLSPEVDITLSNKNTATPHKLMMHLIYWLCFILLHRPLFHQKTRPIYSSDKEIDHVKLCKRAADSIMDNLSVWQHLYGLRYAPVTLFQAVFSAGTVYLLLAIQAASPSKPRLAKSSLMTSLSQVELCVQYLKEVGKSWQSATNIAEILAKLCKDQLKPLLEKNMIGGIDNEERQSAHQQSPTSKGHSSPSSNGHHPPHSPNFVSPSTSSYDSRHSHLESHYSASNWSAHPVSPAAQYTDPSFSGQLPSYLTRRESIPEMPYMPQVIDNVFNPNYDYALLTQMLGFDTQAPIDIPAFTPEESAMVAQWWSQFNFNQMPMSLV